MISLALKLKNKVIFDKFVIPIFTKNFFFLTLPKPLNLPLNCNFIPVNHFVIKLKLKSIWIKKFNFAINDLCCV